MTVVLPAMSNGKRVDFKAVSDHDGIIERFKAKSMEGLLELHNKTPVWNDESQVRLNGTRSFSLFNLSMCT